MEVQLFQKDLFPYAWQHVFMGKTHLGYEPE